MKSIVIGTAGHIDHGKSALVQALTGIDPDRLKEEKVRGITIDLGFAHAQVGGFDVAFVDVPGHERFVKNMLAGVGGIDGVLLVIAADESVMPQTREHFAICRLLQVPSGVVVLTKADLVDRETLDLARMEAAELVAGSALEGAPIVAVSSRTGEGLDDLRDAIAALAGRVPGRPSDGISRLPIDRVFSIRGFGTVVTGTLTAGGIRAEEEMILLPSETRVKVRGVQVHGAPKASVDAGHRVAVNLGGVDVADVRRGDTLTLPDALSATRRFDAVIRLLPDARGLRHGARVRFHQGTVEILGRVALAWLPGDGAAIAEVAAGESAYARIRLEADAVLTRGDRFILRSYSPPMTIGGGRILDPTPGRTPIRTAAGAARFRRLDGEDRDAGLAFVEDRMLAGATFGELARRLGVPAARAREIAAELSAAKAVVPIGDRVVAAPLVAAARDRLVAAVGEHHRTTPLSEGLPREEARERVTASAPPTVFAHIVSTLVDAGRLVGRDRLALPGQKPTLTSEETDAQAALERIFEEAGLAPPDLAVAAAGAHVAPAVADRICVLLLRRAVLVKLDTLLFHREALAQLKREVVASKGEAGAPGVDVAGFKARYGITRKYAIPLLEWLDRERVTRRVGNARVIL
jgi:selenocysteine-specific elongation factor